MTRDDFDRVYLKIKEIYSIVNDLEECFPDRHFTPDGHLVGSIGEVLAAHYYDLELLPASTEKHDARAKNGKMVQIKATQVNTIGLSSEPEHLIVLKILKDGEAEEIFNGPGSLAWSIVGKKQKNGQSYITASRLKKLMKDVPTTERICKIGLVGF